MTQACSLQMGIYPQPAVLHVLVQTERQMPTKAHREHGTDRLRDAALSNLAHVDK